MKKEESKFSQSAILEGMTSVSAVLNTEVENDRTILKIWVDRAKKKSKAAEIGYLTSCSARLGFPMEFVDAEQIDSVTVGSSHGGVIAFCTDRTIPSLSEDRILSNGFYVYLEGIEDPYNFGNAVRSLYAAGVTGIVLPERNWMSAAGVVARSSAGTSERLPIFWADPDTLISCFRRAGYKILCAGIRDSVSVFDSNIKYPVLLVIGGEKRGISRNILDQADQIVRIDYGREFRGSLSASASAAVLAFEIMRKNRT